MEGGREGGRGLRGKRCFLLEGKKVDWGGGGRGK